MSELAPAADAAVPPAPPVAPASPASNPQPPSLPSRGVGQGKTPAKEEGAAPLSDMGGGTDAPPVAAAAAATVAAAANPTTPTRQSSAAGTNNDDAGAPAGEPMDAADSVPPATASTAPAGGGNGTSGTEAELAAIFATLSNPDGLLKNGIEQLYDFKRRHPDVDVKPHLAHASEPFRRFILVQLDSMSKVRWRLHVCCVCARWGGFLCVLLDDAS